MKPSRSPAVDRGGLWLAGGSFVNGLAAFAIISVGTRAFGADGFAPVSIVWTAWTMTAAILTFPTQHWTIREASRRRDEGVVQATFIHLLKWAAIMGAMVAVAAALVGEPLLRTTSMVSPVTLGLLVALAVPVGHVGGRLVAADRPVEAASLTGGENVLRLLAGLLAVAIGLSADWFLLTLAVGPLLVMAWPRFLEPGPRGVPAASVRDVVELSAANSMAQLALAGGPVVLAALAGPDRLVSALFATLALARAPYLILLGASMRLTALWSDRDRRAPRRRAIAGATLAAAVVIGLAAGMVGPAVVGLLFGADAALTGPATGAAAGGATLALGTLVLASRFTTDDDTRRLARGWAIATVVGLFGLLVPASPLARTLTWFVTTELVAVLVLSLGRGPADRPGTGLAAT